MPGPFSRRHFLAQTTIAAAGLGLAPQMSAQQAPGSDLNRNSATFDSARHPVSRSHPRLLGSRNDLQSLAKQRKPEYERVKNVAADEKVDDYSWIISASLVSAVEADSGLAEKVKQRAMKMVEGPVRVGHVTFGYDLALCAIAFDCCSEVWSEADRTKLCEYVNKTVDGNVNSELSVFHNAYYGYKNWGYGLACYATYYENQRAPTILKELEKDYALRAVPALEMAGEGGGWAEGYYIHYWLYEWLFFCEVARRCEGVDYCALASKFYKERAIASVFETYPGLSEYDSRRCIPMGDGGGRLFGGDRDKALNARRILVSRFRDQPLHKEVHAFNETTPRCSIGNYAYKDFLWHDISVPKGDLKQLPLSHLSKGPGFVYARSSWDDDATYFFFKCGDRFTAHQHLDVNHFLIYKHTELTGDGGHYDEFGTTHDVNYHLRTIAHSTMLVLDPDEKWPAIRAGEVTANDGGQHHNWKHHNGAAIDPADWLKQKADMDIADLLVFEEHGDYLYVAGDATRAYASKKLEHFTRQIVFLRPNTFIIFDRVKATKPEFKKTWLLQAMHTPEKKGEHLVLTNGKGRLFVQTLLPLRPNVQLVSGPDLYKINGREYKPRRDTGPAPECRIEVSPAEAKTEDVFLHVLTAGDSGTDSVPLAKAEVKETLIAVRVGTAGFQFQTDTVAFRHLA